MNPNLRATGAPHTLALALAITLCGALAACSKTSEAAGFQRPPASVVIAPAVAKDVPEYLDEIGKVVAREVVSIQPQVSGQITKIHFADGIDVKTGDLLFTIDPRPYQAQLDAAEATLSRGRAVLDLAKVDFARVDKLIGTKAVSQSDYDTKKNAISIAEAQIQQFQAALDRAKLDLEHCSIRAPIDGRAGQRLVDMGNVVTANEGTLLVLQNLDPIYADFTVVQRELTEVQKSRAAGKVKVEVWLPELPNDPRVGELTFVDNAVQDGTGTVKLRATIPNPDRHFWPGRLVNVRLVLRTLNDAVLVPSSAPQMSATGPFVYVVKPDSTAEMRKVTLGQRHGDLLVVTSGVAAGESVVVAGQLGVIPGGPVRANP